MGAPLLPQLVREEIDRGELPLRTYAHFASDDLLAERTVETMLAGLSTRRHRTCFEPTAT